MRRSSLAGVGALAFAVLPIVALIAANDPGGTYKASDIADYVRSGHRPLVFMGLYLSAIGVVGLVPLLARLRDAIADESRARLFWGLGIASTAGFATGLALTTVVPVAMGYGGKGVVVTPATTYVMCEAGWTLIAGAGGIMLGAALLVFALGPVAVPGWVRWSTLVAGIAAILGVAWFPFALLVIWSLALGIWLLARGRVPAAAPVTA